MKWLKRFLFIAREYNVKTKLWIISYTYLPYWIHRVIWKEGNE